MRSEEDIRVLLEAVVAGANYSSNDAYVVTNKVAQDMLTFALGEPSGADDLFLAAKLKKILEYAKSRQDQTHLSA